MIKFVHAADFHLDSPFRNLPADKAAILRREQRILVERLVALCNERQADLLLLSGDLFDSATVYQQTIQTLKHAFAACTAQIFIAPGNHDFVSHDSPWMTQDWGKNVHIFTKNTIKFVTLPSIRCRIYGAAFVGSTSPALLSGFHVLDHDMTNIMVLHGDTDQADSPYNPIRTEQIARSGLDYLALGHIHSFSGEKQAAHTTYAYSGCAMGRGFDELGEKGVIWGEIDENGCHLDFVPLAERCYRILRLPVNALDTLPNDTELDCCRLELIGESEPPDLAAIYAALQDRFFALDIRDCTTPTVDLWAQCGEDSLKGLFLQSIRQELERTTDESERELLKQAARLGLDLMEGREVSLP